MAEFSTKLKRKPDLNGMTTEFKDHVINLILKTNNIQVNQFVDDKCWTFLQAIG